MNNKVNSKKLYDVFLLGVFLLHYYAQSSLIYFLLQWMAAHQMTWYWYFFILFLSYLYLVRLQRLFFTSLRKKQVATIRGIWYWHF